MGVKFDRIMNDIESLTVKFVNAQQYDYLTILSRVKSDIEDLILNGDLDHLQTPLEPEIPPS